MHTSYHARFAILIPTASSLCNTVGLLALSCHRRQRPKFRHTLSIQTRYYRGFRVVDSSQSDLTWCECLHTERNVEIVHQRNTKLASPLKDERLAPLLP